MKISGQLFFLLLEDKEVYGDKERLELAGIIKSYDILYIFSPSFNFL